MSAIVEDELKQIVLTTERGLRIINNGKIIRKDFDRTIGKNSLTGIKIDDNLTSSVSRADITKIVEVQQGNFWLATTLGLVKMYKPNFKTHFLSDSLTSPPLSI